MKTTALSKLIRGGDQRGFTLVELMVALVMGTFFVAATLAIVGHSSRIYRTQERVSNAQQDVRAALDLMMTDIRMAGYDPMRDTNGSLAGIITANATTFEYTADLNASGAIETVNREQVAYTYNAGAQTLTQILDQGTANQQTATVIDNVSAMAFTYLDNAGNATLNPTQIVRVLVTITCQNIDVDKGGTFTRTLTADINCRNLSLRAS